MGQFLLDTDICIFLLKNKHGIKEKITSYGIDNCFISEITVAELLYGAHLSGNLEKHLSQVEQIQKLFKVISITNSLQLFAVEKARLRKSGALIPDFDLMIGVSAVRNKLIMVSNNSKHLSRIEGIKLENWVLK